MKKCLKFRYFRHFFNKNLLQSANTNLSLKSHVKYLMLGLLLSCINFIIKIFTWQVKRFLV